MPNLTAIKVEEFQVDDRFFEATVEIEWEEGPDDDVDERGPSGYSPKPINSKIIRLVEYDEEGEYEEVWEPEDFRLEEPEIYHDICEDAETTLIEGEYDEDDGELDDDDDIED